MIKESEQDERGTHTSYRSLGFEWDGLGCHLLPLSSIRVGRIRMPHSGRDVALFTVPGSRVGHADTPPPRFPTGFRQECGPKDAGKVTNMDPRTPTHTQSHSDSCSQDWRQCCGRQMKAWHAIDYTPTHIKQKGASPAERISRHSSGQALTQQPFRQALKEQLFRASVEEAQGVFFFC